MRNKTSSFKYSRPILLSEWILIHEYCKKHVHFTLIALLSNECGTNTKVFLQPACIRKGLRRNLLTLSIKATHSMKVMYSITCYCCKENSKK